MSSPALGLEMVGLARGGEDGTVLAASGGLAAGMAEGVEGGFAGEGGLAAEEAGEGAAEHVKAEGKLQHEQLLSNAVPDPQD